MDTFLAPSRFNYSSLLLCTTSLSPVKTMGKNLLVPRPASMMKAMNKEATPKRSIRLSRWLLNFLWWIGIVCMGIAIAYISALFAIRPWYIRFIVFLTPFLIAQAFFHGLVLNRFYPDKRLSNTIWVIMMPALFTISFALVLFLMYFFSPKPI